MDFLPQQFEALKTRVEEFYGNLHGVRCPYFGDVVYFNRKGLDHLKFKRWDVGRLVHDQFARFRHLHLAPEILRQSHTLQGICRKQEFERIKVRKKWMRILKVVTYYEFIAVVESRGSLIRVKIIVKQVEDGEKFFWSLIPSWGNHKLTGERILHDGNPEHD